MKIDNINALEHAIEQQSYNEKIYYDLLNSFGGPIKNYTDYLTSQPVDCDYELTDAEKADFNKCLGLLTMILREDHFCDGALVKRVKNGEVRIILERMLFLLKNNTELDL